METVVGIGSAGCNVADKLAQYNLYNVYKIDTNLTKNKRSYSVGKYNSHEEYEKNAPDLKKFFSEINSEVLLVVCGAGNVSGITLKTLKQLVDKVGSEFVNVLYIRPDIQDLRGTIQLQEKLVYNVLQEYARSGMLNNLMLISNPSLENVVGTTPIRTYFQKLNELLVSTLHMINVFDHSEAEIEIKCDKTSASRICTIGLSSFEEDDRMFFPLDNQLEMHYYYAINEETLESDGELMKGIKDKMREINSNNQRGTYSVYSTDYPENYIYLISFSQVIQKSA